MRIAILLAALLAATPVHAQDSRPDRFPQLDPKTMTDAQKQSAAKLPMLSGPFNIMLRSPVLTDRVQALADYLRAPTTLPPRLEEIAILVTARQWNAEYEWFGHYPMAMKTGVSAATADAIAHGKRPEAMQPDEAAVYDLLTELYAKRRISDATFKQARELLGEKQLVDLIGLAGLYASVSMLLDVGEVGLPPGAKPLPPLAGEPPVR
ncbi:MAG TPA: carboxymuconolactone decarboxylase family protein [Alphaproteobacteria bacterium]|nr:carboxymuconolactone decarboxylase family protein [Alphaproteobacteria bacterium]